MTGECPQTSVPKSRTTTVPDHRLGGVVRVASVDHQFLRPRRGARRDGVCAVAPSPLAVRASATSAFAAPCVGPGDCLPSASYWSDSDWQRETVAMARHDNGPPSWHGAVEQAPFDFYEPDTVGDRWAGGFSANGSHIGVAGTIDGFTVMVDPPGENERCPSHSNVARRSAICCGITSFPVTPTSHFRTRQASKPTSGPRRLAQTPTASTGCTWPATIDGSAASRSVMCM